MKRLLLFTLLISSTQVFAATALMSFSTSVYFAPASMRGTSGVRLLDNGVVESFNNKGVTTEVAELSPEALKAVEGKIKALKTGAITSDNGPRCMDAPSTKLEVLKGQKMVVIYQRVNCVDGTMAGADDLISFGRSLQGLSSVLR